MIPAFVSQKYSPESKIKLSGFFLFDKKNKEKLCRVKKNV